MTALFVDLAPQYGVLAIDGEDAATFLQGQATCDARLVSPSRGALGALCNLQGRMIVSFFVLADGERNLRLVMPRTRVAPVLQHLKKYAVFSRVALRDASAELHLTGLLGTGADDALAALTGHAPAQAHAAVTTDSVAALRLHGRHRFLLLSPSVLPVPHGTASDFAHWTQAAIAAGELLVDDANADRFLPQALNYDLIDGVSFKKGCYTGQEVVARMHFKGRMKERLYHGTTDAEAPAAGTAVFRAGETQAAGHVADAVCTGERTHLALVLRHDAAGSDVRLGSGDGPAIAIVPPATVFPELAAG
ncbi:MAG: YgfZ/GcvT domain-containing protein [Pseudomonadota bacterium]